MDPEQKRIFQQMTPEQKLMAALRLYHSAWELKAAFLRQQHPHLREEEIQAQTRLVFSNASRA
ncbi:MAG: hypothetical protein JXL84_20155 [Deltaproteobacteria bacterium]|nr:hypothetical protein [Deltaproteobacteria bacterium]